MSLKNKIDEEIKNAMRAKDQASLRALRAVKSAILLAETAEGRSAGPLSADEEMQLLVKQAKQRRDSMDQFEKNNREDLAATEREELEVIERFLPKQLSEDELKAELTALVSELGASGMKDMGRVMGEANQRFAGRADGKAMAGIVRGLLNS